MVDVEELRVDSVDPSPVVDKMALFSVLIL